MRERRAVSLQGGVASQGVQGSAPPTDTARVTYDIFTKRRESSAVVGPSDCASFMLDLR